MGAAKIHVEWGGLLGITWDQAGHIADSLAVPGFALAIVGFGMTWWQAKEARKQAQGARTAAEAARDAASHTEIEIGRIALIGIAPELHNIETALTDAMLRKNAQDVLDSAKKWREAAVQVRAVIDTAGLNSSKLESLLQESMTLAVEVRTEAVASGNATVPASASELLSVAGKVTDGVNSIAVRQRYRSGEVK